MLRDEPHFFSDLDCLGSTFGAELVKETARVSLDRVFADEEFVSDFAVGHSLGDELEDFQFAFGDAEILQSLFIERKGRRGRDGNFLNDQNFLFLCQLQPEPDTKTRKERGDKAAVNLDRVFHDQETKLEHPQREDQDATAEAVDQYVDERLLLHRVCFTGLTRLFRIDKIILLIMSVLSKSDS